MSEKTIGVSSAATKIELTSRYKPKKHIFAFPIDCIAIFISSPDNKTHGMHIKKTNTYPKEFYPS
jgi:hypothetical protein